MTNVIGMKVKPNASLNRAKFRKNDEFYTRLEDIEKEMIHYKEHFKNAIVYCNCDNPRYSNFWKYFHVNFTTLGLKKLMSTHIDLNGSKSYVMEYIGGGNDSNVLDGVIIPLKGNGDFRSDECVKLLRECDIVITNPPFSLFREYITLCLKNDVKFLILGNQNLSCSNELFSHMLNGKIQYGVSVRHGGMNFYIPEHMKEASKNVLLDENGYFVHFGCIQWFTNIQHNFIPKPLVLTKHYDSLDYPKYDEYDAIEVNKVKNIPCDYEGIMGVPISFLSKWNPEQFEILGKFNWGTHTDLDLAIVHVNGKKVYNRLAIRRKK